MFPRDPHEPKFVTWFRNPKVRRTIILGALWGFIALILLRYRFVLLPFALAILLAFIISPAVDRLSDKGVFGKKVPRAAAVLGIYALGLLALGLFGTWVVGQVGRELSGIGAVTKSLLASAQDLSKQALDWAEAFALQNQIPIDRGEMEAWLSSAFEGMSDESKAHVSGLALIARDLVGGTFRAFFGLFLVLMLCAFLTIDARRIEGYFHSLVPPEYHSAYQTLTESMNVGLAGVVRGQVLICLTNGAFTFVGLWLLSVKLPLILASVATVFSLIPVFGSILSTVPIVAMALTDGLAKGLFALGWIIGIHLLEANFLNPKIMGDAAKIHPVVVVFVLIVGEQTAGLIGALFAVPIAAVVLTVFKFLHKRALEAQAATDDLPRSLSADLPKLSADPPSKAGA